MILGNPISGVVLNAVVARVLLTKKFLRESMWAADQVGGETTSLDLNDFEMPIYSIDREREEGIPERARQFKQALNNADGVVISFAEYNGSYTAAFKNIMDWISRLEKPLWSNKPMLLLATSPGPRGAQGVLGAARSAFPYQGAVVSGVFSLPSFGNNFDSESGITNPELSGLFSEELAKFKSDIHANYQAAAATA